MCCSPAKGEMATVKTVEGLAIMHEDFCDNSIFLQLFLYSFVFPYTSASI